MAYFLNLFTPETWAAFQKHGAGVSGFRYRQRRMATEEIHPGDVFLCYLVRLSRWCGVLEISSEAYTDDTPIFSDPDPFVIRFKVKPEVLLEPEKAIPIFESAVWNGLSFTRDIEQGTPGWAAANFRSSLRRISDDDGDHLRRLLTEQDKRQEIFGFTNRDLKQLARKHTVRTIDREVAVEVPDEDEESRVEAAPPAKTTEPSDETRQSIRIQATVARIGAEMGFRIWIPRSDKARVLEVVPQEIHETFIDNLPLNYDDATLRTIEQIDVIWLKGRSMARAFEVEHTTSIFSGLLRMADLLALQPNMDIRLHIVAPNERGDKVKMEIKRPVFSLLENGPLYEKCTYLSYEAIQSIASEKHLSHMSDTIIEEYEEHAEV
ncbi:MAG: EVE domain-containing protein [Proteobacteria bacterium]|nr:EVE domain-containing protein [Pseudomonadota bacterium]